MTATRVFKWLLIGLTVTLILCMVGVLVIGAIGIHVNLNFLRNRVASIVAEAIDRTVVIEGDVALKVSLFPSLEIHGFRISNLPGWEPAEFARVNLVKGAVAVLPLLEGKIQVDQIRAEGARLYLAVRADGVNNWKFRSSKAKVKPAEKKPKPGAAVETDKGVSIVFEELRNLTLSDLAVTYHDGGLERSYTLSLNELTGSAVGGQPMIFKIKGRLLDKHFAFDLHGQPLKQLLTPSGPWSLDIEGRLGESPIAMHVARSLLASKIQRTLDITAQQVALGGFMRQLDIADDMEIAADRFAMQIVLRGHNLKDVLEASDFKAEIDNGRWQWGGAGAKQSIQASLSNAAIDSMAGQPIRFSAHGRYNRQMFEVSLTGDPLSALMARRMPWQMVLKAGALGLVLEGQGVWDPRHEIPEAHLTLVSPKADSAELFSWLGLGDNLRVTADTIELTIIARGRDPEELRTLSDLRFEIKNALWIFKNPNMASDLHFKIEHLDLKRPSREHFKLLLQGVLSKAGSRTGARPVAIQIQGAARQVRPPGKSSEMAGEYPFNVNLKGNISGTSVTAEGLLAQWQPSISGSLDLSFKNIHFGRLLDWLEIAEDFDMAAGELRLAANVKGSQLEDIVLSSDFSAAIADGHWIIADPNTGAEARIGIHQGSLSALAGRPMALDLKGLLDDIPVQINIQTDPLKAFEEEIEWLPLRFQFQTVGTRMDLRAAAQLPVGDKDMGFQVEIVGDRLDSLDALLDLSLPPWGPYAVSGRLDVKSHGYYLSNLLAKVKHSDLTGRASLDTSGRRPSLDIDLYTSLLQIDDFKVGDWSPMIRSPEEENQAEAHPKETTETGQEEDILALLSPETMRRMDAHIAVAVDEVLSGNDTLGSGSVLIVLKDGRLAVDPFRLEVAGGNVQMAMSYEPTAEDMQASFAFDVERFDYGILARRVKANARMKGHISMDAKLSSRAESFEQMMEQANGHIDIGIWPQDMEAGILDLWAVNLLTAVANKVDDEQASRVNCVIGQFSIQDGLLEQDQLVIDTSRMRVRGEVKADFKTEEVYLMARPQGKRPEFFSLSTPVEAKGKFSDFKTGVAPGGVLGTGIRFISSPLHVPVRRLFSEDLPSEGYDVCKELMPR